MKKTFKTLMFAIVGLLALASCEDVPAPYIVPDKSSNSGAGSGTTVEEGTAVTCAEAVALVNKLADGATSAETYTITGYITQIVGNVSKNQQTFWIADTKDGGKIFEAYWANLPEGMAEFKVGMKVKITGKLMKYVNSNTGVIVPEMKNATVQILDDSGESSDSDEGTAITCAQAVELTNALADGATSTETYTITGYITEVVGSVSKNQQTFWMADTKEGSKVFEAYWANLPEGVTEFTVGTKVKITGKLMKYVKDGKVTPEMKNATVVILNDDGGGSTGEEGISVTCAEAVQLTNALADGATSTETYTITGYITEVIGNVSRNQQTFWMADEKDGGRVFEAYWANLPEGVTEFKAGSKVKITGKLMKFVKDGNVTPEIKNATVVILEDGDGGSQGGGGSTEGTPVTCAEAVQLTNALADGATSTETYSVTGYITEVLGNVSRNQQSFWMADTKDGGKVFEAYWANLPQGVTAFTAGMKVTLTGKLMKYVKDGNVTPEIKNGDVVVLEDGDGGQGGDGGGQGGDGGDPVTDLVNGDFESWVEGVPTGWKSASSASLSTLSQSDESHGGNFSCLVKADAAANKRLATQEITLEAGSYTFSYYAKAATAASAQTKCGYVPVTIVDGKYTVGSYKYGNFANLTNAEWTLVSYDFNLTEKTMVCLVVMNPKSNAGAQYTAEDILVDDATLVKQ